MSNLKPCPFCGGEAKIDTEYDMDGFGNFHKVECRDCGASSKAHFVSSGNECPQYYQEVRDDWNARAKDDNHDPLVEHLRYLQSDLEASSHVAGMDVYECASKAKHIKELLAKLEGE